MSFGGTWGGRGGDSRKGAVFFWFRKVWDGFSSGSWEGRRRRSGLRPWSALQLLLYQFIIIIITLFCVKERRGEEQGEVGGGVI